MASLVLELQRDALDPNVAISDLLRKALVVARKLDVHDFEVWASGELFGYAQDAHLPEYRIIEGQVKAWNPYSGMWIPMVMEDAEQSERLSRRGNNQSVAELEALLADGQSKSVLQMPFSKSIESRLMAGANVPLVPTLIVPRTSISGILDHVRTIVLDWSLRLERDGIVGTGMSFTSEERKRAAEHIYNVTHFHGPVSGSQVQQFSDSSTQHLSVGVDGKALAIFVERVRGALSELALDPEQLGTMDAELAVLAAESINDDPDTSTVRDSLRSVQSIAGAVAGSLLASGIFAQAAKLSGRVGDE